MALSTQPVQGMQWALLRAGSYVYQATCDLTTYSVVPFLATGAIPQSVIGGSGQVAAHEMGIDNTGNSKSVSVMVGKLYVQNVPPYTQTTIELGDTAPMVQVTGGGVCLVTFSTTTVPGTEAATNPYAAALGAIGVFLPAGVMVMYAGPVGNIPVGWLLCDGSAVSRANQPALYQAISTLYGAGDGSSTFNLPDLRGRFARGFDNGAGVDPNRVLGTTQSIIYPSHYHNMPVGHDANGNKYFWNAANSFPSYGYDTYANSNYWQDATKMQLANGTTVSARTSLPTYSGDMAPTNVTVNYIIKT